MAKTKRNAKPAGPRPQTQAAQMIHAADGATMLRDAGDVGLELHADPSAAPAVQLAPPEDPEREEVSPEAARYKLAKFIELFGEADGSAYFAERLTMAAALSRHCDQLKAQLVAQSAAQDAECERLENILHALQACDDVAFVEPEPPTPEPPSAALVSAVGDNLAKAASKLKLPTARRRK